MPEIKNGDNVTVNHPTYGTATGTAYGSTGASFLIAVDTPARALVCLSEYVVARYQMVTT